MRPDVSEIAAYSSRYLSKLVQSRLSFIFISQIRIFKSKNTYAEFLFSEWRAFRLRSQIETCYLWIEKLTLKRERIRTLTEIFNTMWHWTKENRQKGQLITNLLLSVVPGLHARAVYGFSAVKLEASALVQVREISRHSCPQLIVNTVYRFRLSYSLMKNAMKWQTCFGKLSTEDFSYIVQNKTGKNDSWYIFNANHVEV